MQSKILNQLFLTWSPWTPRGSTEGCLGVHGPAVGFGWLKKKNWYHLGSICCFYLFLRGPKLFLGQKMGPQLFLGQKEGPQLFSGQRRDPQLFSGQKEDCSCSDDRTRVHSCHQAWKWVHICNKSQEPLFRANKQPQVHTDIYRFSVNKKVGKEIEALELGIYGSVEAHLWTERKKN